MTAFATFPMAPALHGGSLHLRGKLSALAQIADVTAIGITGEGTGHDRMIVPGLREIVVPLHRDHLDAIGAEYRRLGVQAGDVAIARQAQLTPALVAALDHHVPGADVLLASQPYPVPLLTARSDAPLWLNTHNAEGPMRRQISAGSPAARTVVAEIERLERDGLRCAALVTAVTAEDAAQFVAMGVESERVLVVPNGVDCASLKRSSPRWWSRRRSPLTALLLSSRHPPNVKGAKRLLDLLPADLPVRVIVAGSVCEELRESLAGVEVVCPLTEERKLELLRSADIGLNPTTSGGGMQIKVCEYLAAGLIVISTAYGLRGFERLQPGREIEIAAVEDFASRLDEFAARPRRERAARASEARAYAERELDWGMLPARLRAHPVAARVLGLDGGSPRV